jgi:hypothetical protein
LSLKLLSTSAESASRPFNALSIELISASNDAFPNTEEELESFELEEGCEADVYNEELSEDFIYHQPIIARITIIRIVIPVFEELVIIKN